MSKNILYFFTAIALLATACKPIYRCGETAPAKKDIFIGKRTTAVIAERDSLCKSLSDSEKTVAELQEDTTALNAVITGLNEDIRAVITANDRLQKNYDELSDEKRSEAEKYNAALLQKSEELNEQERRLAEQANQLQEQEQLLSEREKNVQELQQIIARQDSASKRLNEILHNALMGFNADELSVEMKNGKVYVSMSNKLLFSSGSTAVEEKGKEALKVLADVLAKNPDVEVMVEGHTDNVPIRNSPLFKDNWDLSVARATSIVRILTDEYKLTPTRITASGRGEFVPKASNSTAEGRAQNRRTEIILSPQLDEIMQLIK